MPEATETSTKQAKEHTRSNHATPRQSTAVDIFAYNETYLLFLLALFFVHAYHKSQTDCLDPSFANSKFRSAGRMYERNAALRADKNSKQLAHSHSSQCLCLRLAHATTAASIVRLQQCAVLSKNVTDTFEEKRIFRK